MSRYYAEKDKAGDLPPKCPHCGNETVLTEIRFLPNGDSTAVYKCVTEGCLSRKHRIDVYRAFCTKRKFPELWEEIEAVKTVPRKCKKCGAELTYRNSVLCEDRWLKHMFVCEKCLKPEILTFTEYEVYELKIKKEEL